MVWGEGEGKVADARLKEAVPLGRLSATACRAVRFHRLGGALHADPPGVVLAQALRARARFRAGSPAHCLCEGRCGAYAHDAGARARAGSSRTMAWRAALLRSPRKPMSTPAVVRGLIEAARCAKSSCRNSRRFRLPDPDFASPSLNPDQEAAARCVEGRGGGANAFPLSLLDGVTGSGKTETYFEAVAEALQARQADADPAAGNRADGAVSRSLRRALRLPARGMAFRSFAEGAHGASIAR